KWGFSVSLTMLHRRVVPEHTLKQGAIVLKIAARVSGLSESVTLAIDAKAKQMKADGADVINFGAGEPDFDTPDAIKAAAKSALDAGKTKYTAAGGLPELKAGICAKLKADNGLEYKPSQ